LPVLLYVYTGVGGTGSLGGNQKTTTDPGQNGEKSFVALIPNTTSISNIVVTSGNVSARGPVSNVGGAGETIATISNAVFLNLGTFIAVAGTAGTNGGGGTVAGTLTPTQITTGGSGGGGNAGSGPFAVAGFYPAFATITSVAGTGTNGRDGIMFNKPVLAFMGGQGAGGGGTVGGNGGNGSYGCGGGGGGGSLNLGGNGGRGGDGIVIITTSF